MASTTPIAVLAAASCDQSVPVERLVRAAKLLAKAREDHDMTAWCDLELGGYRDTDIDELPTYRSLPVTLMAKDNWGRTVPALWGNTPAPANVLDCALHQPVGEVEQMVAGGATGSFEAHFPPEATALILTAFPGARDIYQVVQRGAVSAALVVIRQRVFDWASASLDAVVNLPGGLKVEDVLGMRFEQTAAVKAPPLTAEPGANITLHMHGVNDSSVIVNSAGATASVHKATSDASETLKALLAALASELASARDRGRSPEEVAPVQQALDELHGLSQMPTHRPSWIRESLASLQRTLEGAAGALLSEAAKPHVLPLLEHAIKAFSS